MSYRDLIVCFHIEIASFSMDHLLKRLYFLQYVFLSTFAKNHMEVTACTYFWIPYFIGLHICFCARIVLFWLLWLSSVIWSILMPSALFFLCRTSRWLFRFGCLFQSLPVVLINFITETFTFMFRFIPRLFLFSWYFPRILAGKKIKPNQTKQQKNLLIFMCCWIVSNMNWSSYGGVSGLHHLQIGLSWLLSSLFVYCFFLLLYACG